MTSKWSTSFSKKIFKGRIWFIPCLSIWYDKYTFLETGVYTPSFGIQFAFISISFGFTIQKTY